MLLKKFAKTLFDKTDLWLKAWLFFTGRKKTAPLVRCKGIIYDMDFSDGLQRRILCNFYENKSLKQIEPLIPKEGVFIDVGANVGFYTLNIAKSLENSGKIYAFEPDKTIAKRLERNCSLNPFCKNVSIIPKAISNLNGKRPFYQLKGGAGSLNYFPDIKANQIEVPVMTLDSFLEQEKISSVDLIKIDIEASEMELLEGAKEALRAKVLKNILIEFNGPRLYERGVTFEEFFALFRHYDYTCQTPILKKNPRLICANFLFKSSQRKLY